MHRIPSRDHLRTCHLGLLLMAMIATMASSGSCVLDTETTMCEASGRRCAPGQMCAAYQDACIPIEGCGDGIVNVEKGEVCDDGNIRNGDSCSSDCSTDKLCGNSVIDRGEECDSGPEDSLGCDKDCTLAECGDGYVNEVAGEDCDTGDVNVNTSTCNGRFCKMSACGDSVFNAAATEACDTGADTQACNGNNGGLNGAGSCQIPQCGDAYTNPSYTPPGAGFPEECDAGGANTLQCNGNNNGMNGPGSCRAPQCGDGYANPSYTPPGAPLPEECDTSGVDTLQCNGNNGGLNGTGSCRVPRCGDGYTNRSYIPPGSTMPEECDTAGVSTSQCNGNNNGTNGHGSCRVPACGDGYINIVVGETCDKGNPPTIPDIGCGGQRCNNACDGCM